MSYDVLVIGAGSGGLAAAKAAAATGARVAIAESQALGGTCVNRGCVPKKLMVNAADFVKQQRTAASLKWSGLAGSFDWPAFQSAMMQHLDSIRQSQQESLSDAGIDIFRGTAHFAGPNKVMVDEASIEARHIIIAVGGAPTVLEMPGKEHVLTSKEMFQLAELPQQLAIIGGGYIGVEFSHVFSLLGSQVTLIDSDQRVLEGFDDVLRDAVQAGLQRMGVNFIPNSKCKEIKVEGDLKRLILDGDAASTTMADTVLMAVGRSPNLAALKLDKAGVTVEDGQIQVDDYGQTSQPSVYAIGDCVGRLPLTPVAIAEGEAVIRTICQQQPTTVDYRWIPSAVFGEPTVATVGWPEQTAKEKLGDDLETQVQEFTPLSHSLLKNAQKSSIKWIIQKSSQQILGVHIAGEKAPEMIQGLVPMLRAGLTVDVLKNSIPIHPTSAEELFNLSEN